MTLTFGIDPGGLAAVGAGAVAIWAELDSRERPGMWQGVSRSRELRLRALDPRSALASDELRARGFRRAGYFLADERFAEAEREAGALVAQFPDYIGGWLRQGEAAAGQGRTDEALVAFRRALRLYYEQASAADGTPIEHPEYTARRIAELEAELDAANAP